MACAGRIVCMLRRAGLRPTRQRSDLARLLFSGVDRHVTAEALYAEAATAGIDVSLATIYNTLNQFTEGGLLRQVAIDSTRTFFDTNTSDHHHLFVEGEAEPRDLRRDALDVIRLAEAPDGLEVVRVDVVVRLRPRALPADPPAPKILR